jgi:glycosidase
MTKLANTIADDALYPHPERLVVLFDNHDNARFLSGGGSAAAMRLAYAFVMTTRGTPQLYYGDEILMAGGEDPDNRKDFPGGFNSRSPNAFVESGRTPEQQAMFAWVSTLAKIRKDYPALACGAEQILKSNDDWLVYVRDPAHAAAGACTLSESDRNVPVVIAIHRGEKPSDLSFNTQGTWIQSCTLAPDLLSHNVPGKPSPGGEQALSLQGNEVLISPCRADPSQNPGVR